MILGFTNTNTKIKNSDGRRSDTSSPRRGFSHSDASFTLIEMLVAATIFVSVVTVISTIFISGLRAQRQSLAYRELLDQTSYLLEYMSRSLRMAMKDDIAIRGFPLKNCLNGNKVNYEFEGDCLKFRNYKNECQEFCLKDIGGGRKKIVEIIYDGTTVEVDLTSPDLNVKSFEVKDPRSPSSWKQPPEDYFQPLVEILLEIEGREQSKIQIKTSISQRNLDVQR